MSQLALNLTDAVPSEPLSTRRRRTRSEETKLHTIADYFAASLDPASELYVAQGTYTDEQAEVQQAGA